ncbi:MAG: nucleoprotein/polynucleotide-associated enzyme [Moraxellaceae bacterium]|jgi:uncharacterized protein YaiL (DUF2058 family)|nr:nucleoprotein/polynucleotide-associated enzyme [Moraxellaceae bacterium]
MSLKDQLMKAGLADARKARKAEHEKRQQAKDPNAESAQQLAEKATAEKAERDRALNRAQQEEKEKRAVAAQIRQLIEGHRIARAGGDVSYQFTDEKKVKKLYVTAAQQTQLANGQVAIVRLGDGYELVPTVVAEKIRQRDTAAVVLLNNRKAGTEIDADDPYAAYQVPDDLMW